jgi:hypothetical protein
VPLLSVAAVIVRYARQQLAELEPAPPDSPPAAAGQPNPSVTRPDPAIHAGHVEDDPQPDER